MTLLSERTATHEANETSTYSATRRDSYVTLPGEADAPRRAEGAYVTVPGASTGSGNQAQGSYVTLHSAPLGETEISYTRVG